MQKSEIPKMRHYAGFSQIGLHMPNMVDDNIVTKITELYANRKFPYRNNSARCAKIFLYKANFVNSFAVHQEGRLN